jgi:hypothetical protein
MKYYSGAGDVRAANHQNIVLFSTRYADRRGNVGHNGCADLTGLFRAIPNHLNDAAVGEEWLTR